MRLSELIEVIPWTIQQFLIAVGYGIVCHGSYMDWEKGNRKKCVRGLLEEAGIFIFLSVFGIGVNFLIPGSGFPAIWICVLGGVLALYLKFFSNHCKSAKLILWCSMFAGIQALTSLAGMASYLIGLCFFRGWPEAVIRICVYFFIPCLALYLARFNFDEFEKLPAAGMTLILSGDLCLMLLVISESIWQVSEVNAFKRFVTADICLFGIVLVSIYVLYSICRDHEMTLILREEKQQLQKEKERIYMAEEQMDEIRSIQHDLKNQRHYMKILIKEKRYEELENYFAENKVEFPVSDDRVQCGNSSVNVILNMEYAKLDPDIKIDSLLVIPPILPFAEEELCSVLTNILDNAIEECKRIKSEGIKNPSICLEIYPEANYLYIMCRNTTNKSQLVYWKDGVRSTREDSVCHGYGTQIASRIAEKYNGCAEYIIKEGCFVAKIMMDMMGGKGCD